MSEEQTTPIEDIKENAEVVSSVLENPLEDIPPEKLLGLLEIWKQQVEAEIADHDGKKQKIYVVYKRQKDMYDRWLSGPMNKMKKLDGLINGRKKVLMDVSREIKQIKDKITTVDNV
jgi:hypothetical protein